MFVVTLCNIANVNSTMASKFRFMKKKGQVVVEENTERKEAGQVGAPSQAFRVWVLTSVSTSVRSSAETKVLACGTVGHCRVWVSVSFGGTLEGLELWLTVAQFGG